MEIESIWTWILVVGVSAIVFLGYHFMIRVDEAERRRFLLPESEVEAKARYRAAWRKYRRLRYEVPLLIPGWFVFAVLLTGFFRLVGWNQKIAVVFILAYVPYTSFVAGQWNYWQCPRCGKAFKWSGDLFFPKRCHYCNLPMWAESPNQ